MKNADKPIYPLQHEGFPSHERAIPNLINQLAGLTKREYFAAMAMQGMLSNSALNYGDEFSAIAQKAVTCADILLSELDKIEMK